MSTAHPRQIAQVQPSRGSPGSRVAEKSLPPTARPTAPQLTHVLCPRAVLTSKQVDNDAFPPRARLALRCGHAPCTTRGPFLDSLARAVTQERAVVFRARAARANRHRRSPRCRSLAPPCARRNRKHIRSPQFYGASRGATGAQSACASALCVRLCVSVVDLLSVLIPPPPPPPPPPWPSPASCPPLGGGGAPRFAL